MVGCRRVSWWFDCGRTLNGVWTVLSSSSDETDWTDDSLFHCFRSTETKIRWIGWIRCQRKVGLIRFFWWLACGHNCKWRMGLITKRVVLHNYTKNIKPQTHKTTNPHLWFLINTQTHPHINAQTHKFINAYINQSTHKAINK